MAIGIIILAAGASTRMGQPKQLLSVPHTSLLRQTVEAALGSQCQEVVVILGAHAESIRPTIAQLPIQIVENTQWVEGIGSSIRAGVQAIQTLSKLIDATIITTCDQPFLTSELFNQLIEAYRTSLKPIIACEYAGTVGIPALFDVRFFSELLSLQGDRGAKKLLMAHQDEVGCVPFPEGAIDLDTPEQVTQFLTGFQ